MACALGKSLQFGVGLMVQAEAGLPDWPELRGRSFKLLRDEDSLGYYDGE